jgi:hypothetical protein
MRLDGGHFNSQFNCTSTACASSVSLTKNGVLTSSVGSPTAGFSFGNVNGMLLGTGLNGAGLQYSVRDTVPSTIIDSNGNRITTFSDSLIQGVTAFAGPTQDVNTPFRAAATSDGWDYNVRGSSGGGTSFNLAGLYRGSVSGDIQPVARVIGSAAGLHGYDHAKEVSDVRRILPGLSERTFQSRLPRTALHRLDAGVDLSGAIAVDGESVVAIGGFAVRLRLCLDRPLRFRKKSASFVPPAALFVHG